MSLWGRSSQDTTWEDEEELEEEERWGSSLPPKAPPSVSLISGATKSGAHEVGGLGGTGIFTGYAQKLAHSAPVILGL